MTGSNPPADGAPRVGKSGRRLRGSSTPLPHATGPDSNVVVLFPTASPAAPQMAPVPGFVAQFEARCRELSSAADNALLLAAAGEDVPVSATAEQDVSVSGDQDGLYADYAG